MNSPISATAARPDVATTTRNGVLVLLMLVMAGTRINHFAPLPDASCLVFVAAGFYLSRAWRWVFPLLGVEAVLVDYLVISNQGLSFWQHYCVSAAYWFLVPSYLAMWFGGSWLARAYRGLGMRELALACAAFFVAFNLCYLISNGSFYWLSDSVPLPRSAGAWFANLGDWYPFYLRSQGIYFAIGTALHALVVMFGRALPAAQRNVR